MKAPTRGIQVQTVENIQSLLSDQLIDSFPQLFSELTQEVRLMYYNSMKRVTGSLLTRIKHIHSQFVLHCCCKKYSKHYKKFPKFDTSPPYVTLLTIF